MRRGLCLAALLVVRCAHCAPFATTDQNPLLAGFGMPTPFSARLATSGTTDLGVTLNWSNVEIIQQSANEHLIVDAESADWRLAIEHAWSDRLATRLTIPYRSVSGGSLDNFIEHWHAFFGLPNGKRDSLPRNDQRIEYRHDQALASFDHETSGLGDVSLAVGYQLLESPRSASSLWWNIKFPSGDSQSLTGSGTYDTSISFAHESALSSRWLLSAQANAIYLGSGDLLPSQQKQVVWSGFVGFDYRYSNSLALTVQLDAHT